LRPLRAHEFSGLGNLQTGLLQEQCSSPTWSRPCHVIFEKKIKTNFFLHLNSKKNYLFVFVFVKILTPSRSFTTGGTVTGIGLKRALGGPKSLVMCSLFLNLDSRGRKTKFNFSENKISKLFGRCIYI